MISSPTPRILGFLLISSAVACGGAPGPAAPAPAPARSAAPLAAVPPQDPASPPDAPTAEPVAKPSPSADPQTTPEASSAPAVSQEIADSPGAPALEAGAAAVKKGDFGKARTELTRALKSLDASAHLEPAMVAHALLARSCDRLGDRKCAEKEYSAVLSLSPDRGLRDSKPNTLGPDPAAPMPSSAGALLATGEALYFFAEQKRLLADKLTMPSYTGSGSKDDVLKHINTKVSVWIRQKNTLIDDAERAYIKILQINPVPPPRWVIDAAARVGAMWDRFATSFRETPMPKEWSQKGPIPGSPDMTYEELRAAYLSQIDSASEPMVAKARSAFKKCQEYSIKFKYTDELSKGCDEWLKNHPT